MNLTSNDLEQADTALYRATYRKSGGGQRPRFLRMPQGILTDNGLKAASLKARPYSVVGANIDIRSYELPTTDIAVRQLLERLSGGDSFIYVGRDNGTMYIDGVKNIITYMKKNNYTFVTIDQCLGGQPYLPADYATPLFKPINGFSISETDLIKSFATSLSLASSAATGLLVAVSAAFYLTL
jgi:peptidoglycan/xylan/chitin deacetylase (PgdA/CDA1 family)